MRIALRRHRTLLLALVVGAAAFALSFSVMSSYVRSEPVVVAVRDVEAYRQLSAGDVAVRELPAKAVPQGRLTKPADAIGRYARSRLVSGQIVMAAHLVAGETGLSYDLPPEQRGVFLPVPADRAVGGMVKQGERIDLIAVPRVYAGLGAAAGGAVTLARSLLVLEAVRDPSSQEFLGVVVLATPGQCETVAANLEEGTVYLCLVPRLAPAEEVETEVWAPK